MIASHYAEPIERRLRGATTLHSGPSADSDAMQQLAAGEAFSMLDDSLGWAWGYAGGDRRVGYVPSGTLSA